MNTILIVEDKESMARMLNESLSAEGFEAHISPDGPAAVEALKQKNYDLVLSDLNLPGLNGIEVLRNSKEMAPLRPVIVMTAYGSIETAVDAMKEGAYDFITKPFNVDHLIMLINRALDNKRIVTENLILRDEVNTQSIMPDIIGKSKAIKDIADVIHRVAPSKTTVLLEGMSGTGKELFARAIHQLSDRRAKPFIAINCAAIPKDLMESEFFGHEKGAFTGADARKLGKFELASGGTIFLDEIAEMDKKLQAKLLRILQEEELDRVGGNKPVPVDVRVIAASNRNLAGAVEAGEFRDDLFYRINVFPIRIPPLRERPEDIPLLADFLIKKLSRKLGKGYKKLSDDALHALTKHDWKGNVRELENALERAIILCDSEILPPSLFNINAPGSVDSPSSIAESDSMNLEHAVKKVSKSIEEDLIRKALGKTSGNKTKAAALLEVSYKTLLTKIKEYEIN